MIMHFPAFADWDVMDLARVSALLLGRYLVLGFLELDREHLVFLSLFGILACLFAKFLRPGETVLIGLPEHCLPLCFAIGVAWAARIAALETFKARLDSPCGAMWP